MTNSEAYRRILKEFVDPAEKRHKERQKHEDQPEKPEREKEEVPEP